MLGGLFHRAFSLAKDGGGSDSLWEYIDSLEPIDTFTLTNGWICEICSDTSLNTNETYTYGVSRDAATSQIVYTFTFHRLFYAKWKKNGETALIFRLSPVQDCYSERYFSSVDGGINKSPSIIEYSSLETTPSISVKGYDSSCFSTADIRYLLPMHITVRDLINNTTESYDMIYNLSIMGGSIVNKSSDFNISALSDLIRSSRDYCDQQ